MKNIIIFLAALLFFNKLNAKSDSLNYITDSTFNVEIIDSNLIEENNHLNIEVETNSIVKKFKKREKTLTKPANWFSDAWDAFTDLFKPVWGHYTEDGFRSEGPYFIFDRNIEGPTYVQIQMQQVQDKIK